jgi:hypothetical protein
MHRRKTRLELAALLLFTAASTAIPAHANGFATNTRTLPDASKIYPAPLQADIVDTGPIVRDTRKAVDNTTYIINVGPPPTGQNRVVKVGVGGDGTTNGVNNAGSETIPLRPNYLPPAGLRSNIPAMSPVTGVLLPGQVGHRLDTKAAIRPRLAQTGSHAAQSAPGAKLQSAGRVPTAVYPTSTSKSSTLAGDLSSTTLVKGDLLPKR